MQTMTNELFAKLFADQADQLGPTPATHISETCAWIRGKWSSPNADPAWLNLRLSIRTYDSQLLFDFLAKNAPTLADSEPKKNWLLNVIDTLKLG